MLVKCVLHNAVVLEAKWLRNERVAVKLLRAGNIENQDETLDNFQNEVKLLCGLRHPCIVNVYGAILEHGSFLCCFFLH